MRFTFSFAIFLLSQSSRPSRLLCTMALLSGTYLSPPSLVLCANLEMALAIPSSRLFTNMLNTAGPDSNFRWRLCYLPEQPVSWLISSPSDQKLYPGGTSPALCHPSRKQSEERCSFFPVTPHKNWKAAVNKPSSLSLSSQGTCYAPTRFFYVLHA